MLYAHTPWDGSDDWHDLGAHLSEVADRAARNAEGIGASDLARWAGGWHDVGKASVAFQAYLRACHADPKKRHPTTDHKAAGAALALGSVPDLAFLIQGHHGGLPDLGTLKEKMKTWKGDPIIADTQRRAIDGGVIPAVLPEGLRLPSYVTTPQSREFFLRMLFSALVDADHADTEQHSDPTYSAERGGTPDLRVLEERLEAAQVTMAAWVNDTGRADEPVNVLRRDVYQACLRAAVWSPGFFRLTVPTGGGKTRSALAFALRHARADGQRRIVVAVPYLTITEQTVDVYRQVLGDDRAVLEHHSGAGSRAERENEQGGETPRALWRRLAAQDWAAPVIVTTTVQLFESLFGRTPARCRKLHRLAQSVIVLDEAQALPTHLLAPILDGLRELVANYGATVVLCTATQPEFAAVSEFSKLGNVREIAPVPSRLFRVLDRVRYEWPSGEPWSWERVADELRGAPQALAIVNTKKDTLALLDALGDDDTSDERPLHLSTLLCGAHRRDVLAIVRRRLEDGRPCRLVSTQVVEAGVDLDFPLVLRAIGPLDRIVQAAGRCNREGRLAGKGRVVVFEPEGGGMPPGAYRTATDATRMLLAADQVDPNDPATFARYFRQLFTLLGSSLDREGIQPLRAGLAYEQVAEKFRMIPDDTVSVVVRYGGMSVRDGRDVGFAGATAEQHHSVESTDVIEELRRAAAGNGHLGAAKRLFARAQPYVVSVRERDLKEAVAQGAATEVIGGFWAWEGGYDDVRGLTLARPPEELVV